MDDVLSGDARERRTGGFGPSVLVLAVLSVAWLASRHTRTIPHKEPLGDVASRVERLADVDVWVGLVPVEGAGTLRVRLAPLHADPARQSFDAAAIARRLDIDGEPWRLEVAYDAPADSSPLVLDAVELVDERGATWRRPSAPAATSVTDPLHGLFSAPAVLEAGAASIVVLIGPRPQGAVRIVGLGAKPGADLGGELVAASVEGDQLSGPLTRVAANTGRAAR